MTETLNLPPEVKPIWVEGLFTSEYERDTLPLLFSTDKVYHDYYDALKEKNASMSIAIDQIRERNNLARMERQEGMWMECVDSLLYCANLRKAIFAENDFQFVAAQKHHIMSLLNFATFFLRESTNAKTKEAMLMRSYELFKKAEESVAHVRGREARYFLKTALENNYSVYFARRKKYCAAAQRMVLAVRAWTPLKLSEHQFYFAVQKSSGDLWSGRLDDAINGLKHAAAMVSKRKHEKAASPPRQRTDQDYSDDDSSSQSSDDVPPRSGGAPLLIGHADDNHAPFRYNIHVLNSKLNADIASHIALNHNLGVAYIAQRRYKEAIGWIAKSLEVAAAHSVELPSSHPMIIVMRNAEEFCQKMAMGTKMSQFRMKRDDHSAEQYRAMQAAVAKTRNVHSASGRKNDSTSEERDGDAPKHSRSPTPRRSGSAAPRFAKPSHVEALQTYLKNFSYRQLVEDYGFEDPKKRRTASKSPPNPKAPKPPSQPRGESQSANKNDNVAKEEDGHAASPPDTARSQRSSRSATTPKKQSASSPRTPSSSRSSSRSHTPSSRNSSPDASPARIQAVEAKQEEAEAPSAQEEEHKTSDNGAVVVTPYAVKADTEGQSAVVTDVSVPQESEPATTPAPQEGDGDSPKKDVEEASRDAQQPADTSIAEHNNQNAQSSSNDADSTATSGTDHVRDPAVAHVEEVKPDAAAVARAPETAYGDEAFDSASEANSPEKSAKPQQPTVVVQQEEQQQQKQEEHNNTNSALEYTNDFDTTVNSNFSPLPPARNRTDDESVPSALGDAPPQHEEKNADEPAAAPKNETTYDDEFDSTSEANSPAKAQQITEQPEPVAPQETTPAAANESALEYTNDFDATANSNFSPPPPARSSNDGEPAPPPAVEPQQHEEKNADEPSAVQGNETAYDDEFDASPAADDAEPAAIAPSPQKANDTTYGNDDFEEED